MADKSAIEWTEATWTAIRATQPNGRWMCQKVSPGCDNCYAERLNQRFGGFAYRQPGTHRAWMRNQVQLDEKMLVQPLRWQRGRRIFVCSMTDLFGEWVPDEWIDKGFAVMAGAPQHTFQVLTKRAKRMQEYVGAPGRQHRIEALMCAMQSAVGCPLFKCREDCQQDWTPDWPLPNVWLGVSVENQDFAWRINHLAQSPAAVRFVSAEPLLGSLDLSKWLNWQTVLLGEAEREPIIDWVITGGESGGPAERRLVERCGWCGSGAPSSACHVCHGQPWQPKPQALEWVRGLRDQCTAAGVAFLHKQWGGPTPKSGGRLVDGRLWDEYPVLEEEAA